MKLTGFRYFLFGAICLQATCYDCPAPYRMFSDQHTFCLPQNPNCLVVKSGVSYEDRNLILNLHNQYRSRVANGLEYRNRQPPAADMMQMEWDDELAILAQKHAERCLFEHDCEACRAVDSFSVGQNLAQMMNSSLVIPTPNWTSALQGLYDEVADFRPEWIARFTAPTYPMTGHYSQIVWGRTWRIGCGYVVHTYPTDPKFTYTELYTCNYGPAGNVRRQEMYAAGRVCTQCPENTCCDNSCALLGVVDNFKGLCKSLDGRGPQPNYPRGKVFIWCNFVNSDLETDLCNPEMEGAKKWETHSIIAGNYRSVTLQEGENTILRFPQKFMASGDVCVKLVYRKGSTDPKNYSYSSLVCYLVAQDWSSWYALTFLNDTSGWSPTSASTPWSGITTFTLTFSVPIGTPPQHLDLQEILVLDGKC